MGPFTNYCSNGYLEDAIKYYRIKPTCLEEMVDGWTPLFHAVRGGHLDIVKWLIRVGADKTARSIDNNYTILHLAAILGDLPLVEELCLEGLDLNSLTKDDETPEELATNKGHKLCAQYLINFRSRMIS